MTHQTQLVTQDNWPTCPTYTPMGTTVGVEVSEVLDSLVVFSVPVEDEEVNKMLELGENNIIFYIPSDFFRWHSVMSLFKLMRTARRGSGSSLSSCLTARSGNIRSASRQSNCCPCWLQYVLRRKQLRFDLKKPGVSNSNFESLLTLQCRGPFEA